MNHKAEFCYWCGKAATSKEHVPPKCLFPEEKDIIGVYNKNFRDKLITVPSCDEHNMGKSQDDQYLMACLAPNFGNNGVAYIHTQTKVRRALERKKDLYKVLEDKTIKINNKIFPVMMIQVDNYRIVHSFEAIARALYFYRYNKQFKGSCKVIPIFLKDVVKDTEWNQFCDLCVEVTKPERKNWIIQGYNPDVFKYQFGEEDKIGCQMLIITLYNNLEVYIAFANSKAIDILNLKKE